MKKIINPSRNHPEYNCFGCCPDNPIGLHMEFFAEQSGKAERYEDGDYIVSKWHPEKMEKTGWTIEKAPNVNAPVFKEFPMTLEGNAFSDGKQLK